MDAGGRQAWHLSGESFCARLWRLQDNWLVTMRRTIAVLFAVLALIIVAQVAWAAPRAVPRSQATLASITSPEPLKPVRGQVTITGSATHSQFQRYELYYKLEPGEDWIFIGDAHFQPVENGPLGVWATSSLPDGTYSLRLRVVRQDGNYDEAFARQVLVANAQPTETPTPEVSPTPTTTPSPLPPTPTIVIELPVIPTSTPRPTDTPTASEGEEVVAAPPGDEEDSGGLFGLNKLISQINVQDIGGAFLLGAQYALAAFISVGVFFFLKRVLAWLWARIRG